MSSAARPIGHHHGDLRNALEEAALEIVLERGVQGFTLTEASRRAGVSRGAPYRHYANREALLASLAERCYRLQHERFSTAMATASSAVDKLAGYAGESVRFAADERSLFLFTFGAGLDKSAFPSLAEAGERVLDLLNGPALDLRGDPGLAQDLVMAVGAVAHGYATFHIEGVLPDREAAADHAESAARILSGTPAQ
jgi:AcrR family transcriptional regulator